MYVFKSKTFWTHICSIWRTRQLSYYKHFFPWSLTTELARNQTICFHFINLFGVRRGTVSGFLQFFTMIKFVVTFCQKKGKRNQPLNSASLYIISLVDTVNWCKRKLSILWLYHWFDSDFLKWSSLLLYPDFFFKKIRRIHIIRVSPLLQEKVENR